MDQETILHHLHIPRNSFSHTKCNQKFVTLVISLLLCAVLMCGITFAVIVLEREAGVKNKVNSHEVQLQNVKTLIDKLLPTNSSESSSFRAVALKEARKDQERHPSSFGFTSRKVSRVVNYLGFDQRKIHKSIFSRSRYFVVSKENQLQEEYTHLRSASAN